MVAAVDVLLTRARYPDRLIDKLCLYYHWLIASTRNMGALAMKQRLKQYFLIALAAAALYFVLDNHFVFQGYRVYLLRKTTLNLHDTFVSLDNKRPETLMENDYLRDAGIGDLLVELGMLTDEKRSQLESRYGYDD